MTLPGFDVSEAQGVINWPAVASAGQAFVFVKAWEHRADHQWAANWDGARTSALVRGAYCFARPGAYAAHAQATAFANQVGRLGAGDLPLVLDLEDDGGLSSTQLVAWAREFLTTCDQATGRKSILYTYSGFLASRLRSDVRLNPWPLWIANYSNREPQTPWPWTFWQNADNGTIPGIVGPVDVNQFARGPAELAYLAQAPVASAQPAPPSSSGPAVKEPNMILVPGATPQAAFGNRFPYWSVKGRQLLGFNGAPIQGGSSAFGVSYIDVPAPADLTGLDLAPDGVTLVASCDADGGTYTYKWHD